MFTSRWQLLACWLTLVVTGWAGSCVLAGAPEDLAISPDSAGSPPLAIPSVTAGFASLTDVSEAVEADRQRITLLERRLQELEAATQAEPLPTPGEAASATPAMKASPPDAVAAAAKDTQQPTPYEIGSDTTLGSKRASGYQAESKQKDF